MLIATLIVLLLCGAPLSFSQPEKSYAMYVWRDGWDASVPGCDNEATFLDWSNAACFTHSWNTAAKREWLWSTCERQGRQVNELYLYDTQDALATRNCNNPGVQLIMETLSEGRQRIPGLAIYALFSDGGDSVPEQQHVPHVVWYNAQCAANQQQRFEGVAVNNENWNKAWSEAQMISYLDNLNGIRLEADKQLPPGSLQTHFSVGWHWGKDEADQDILLDWGGRVAPVMRHFIDIFHHLDVQVAFVTADAMDERLRIAEWDYALQLGKPQRITAYINKALPCQITFFPFASDEPDCPAWSHGYKSETAMFSELDDIEARFGGARACLHYFRGAYSSGGHPDWPRH